MRRSKNRRGTRLTIRALRDYDCPRKPDSDQRAKASGLARLARIDNENAHKKVRRIRVKPLSLQQIPLPYEKINHRIRRRRLFLTSVGAFADADTPQTRRREAERYLQATPPKAMFQDMAEKMAAN